MVTVAEYNAMVADRMREEVLQLRVEELLRTFDWWWFHDQDPRRNQAGLPDTIAMKPGRLLFAELKSQKGKLRPKQAEVRGHLESVVAAIGSWNGPPGRPPVEYHLWRPSDLLSGAIERALR